MECCLVSYFESKFGLIIPKINKLSTSSLLEVLIPAGLRIKTRPTFKPVSNTIGKENSVLYNKEKKNSWITFQGIWRSCFDFRSRKERSINKILEDLEKKHRAYKDKLLKRQKKWGQIRFREAISASNYKLDFKHKEGRNGVKKSTNLGLELNKGNSTTVQKKKKKVQMLLVWMWKVNLVMNLRLKTLKIHCAAITLRILEI